jgi:phospholipase/carboxylesterase
MTTLIHRIHLPSEANPARRVAAVVMLHGWRGDENVMWLFKQTIPLQVAIVAPRAPLAVEAGGYSWFLRNGAELQPTPPASLLDGLAQLDQFLKQLPERYPIDPTRLVLLGFSQGASMGNSLVLSQPKRVMAVASLSGLLPDIIIANQAPQLAGLPVFIAHGLRDEIVPLAAARQTREIYIRLGAQVTYGEYPTGHKMNVQGMADLKKWLAQRVG